MSIVFKGLICFVLIRGLGVLFYFFFGMCVICVLFGVWIYEVMYVFIFSGWYVIK